MGAQGSGGSTIGKSDLVVTYILNLTEFKKGIAEAEKLLGEHAQKTNRKKTSSKDAVAGEREQTKAVKQTSQAIADKTQKTESLRQTMARAKMEALRAEQAENLGFKRSINNLKLSAEAALQNVKIAKASVNAKVSEASASQKLLSALTKEALAHQGISRATAKQANAVSALIAANRMEAVSSEKVAAALKHVETQAAKTTARMGTLGRAGGAMRNITMYGGAGMLFYGAMGQMNRGYDKWKEQERGISYAQRTARHIQGFSGQAGREKINTAMIGYTTKHLISAKEYSEALYQVTTALDETHKKGLKANEVLRMTETTLNLAGGMGHEVEETAKSMARLYNVMGTDGKHAADEYQRMANVITTAWKDQPFDLNELVEGFKQSANEAKAAGMSFEELTGVLAVLHKNMVAGGRSGRMFRQVMLGMIKKGDEVAEAIGDKSEQLGLGRPDSKQFDDKSKPLQVVSAITWFSDQIRKNAQESGKDYAVELKKNFEIVFSQNAMEQIFGMAGKRAAGSFMALAEEGDELERLIRILEEAGKAKRDFAEELIFKAEGDPAAQMEILRSNLDRLIMGFIQGVAGGNNMTQALLNINRQFPQLIQRARDFGETVAKMVSRIADLVSHAGKGEGAIKKVTGALRTLSLTIQSLLAIKLYTYLANATLGFTTLRPAATAATAATRGFGLALSALPWVAAGLGAKMLIDHLAKIKDEYADVVAATEKLARIASSAKSDMRDMVGPSKGMYGGAAERILYGTDFGGKRPSSTVKVAGPTPDWAKNIFGVGSVGTTKKVGNPMQWAWDTLASMRGKSDDRMLSRYAKEKDPTAIMKGFEELRQSDKGKYERLAAAIEWNIGAQNDIQERIDRTPKDVPIETLLGMNQKAASKAMEPLVQSVLNNDKAMARYLLQYGKTPREIIAAQKDIPALKGLLKDIGAKGAIVENPDYTALQKQRSGLFKGVPDAKTLSEWQSMLDPSVAGRYSYDPKDKSLAVNFSSMAQVADMAGPEEDKNKREYNVNYSRTEEMTDYIREYLDAQHAAREVLKEQYDYRVAMVDMSGRDLLAEQRKTDGLREQLDLLKAQHSTTSEMNKDRQKQLSDLLEKRTAAEAQLAKITGKSLSEIRTGGGYANFTASGLNLKPGAQSRGSAHEGTYALASIISQNLGVKYFSALNDKYHSSGKHPKGLAADFVLSGGASGSASAASYVRQLLSSAGAGGYVQDEYKYPSKNSTGNHIHVQFNSKEDADMFKQWAKNQGLAGTGFDLDYATQDAGINAAAKPVVDSLREYDKQIAELKKAGTMLTDEQLSLAKEIKAFNRDLIQQRKHMYGMQLGQIMNLAKSGFEQRARLGEVRLGEMKDALAGRNKSAQSSMSYKLAPELFKEEAAFYRGDDGKYHEYGNITVQKSAGELHAEAYVAGWRSSTSVIASGIKSALETGMKNAFGDTIFTNILSAFVDQYVQNFATLMMAKTVGGMGVGAGGFGGAMGLGGFGGGGTMSGAIGPLALIGGATGFASGWGNMNRAVTSGYTPGAANSQRLMDLHATSQGRNGIGSMFSNKNVPSWKVGGTSFNKMGAISSLAALAQGDTGAGIGGLIGSAFGPMGSMVGGLLGGMFKKKKGTEAPIADRPADVHVVNFSDLAKEMSYVLPESSYFSGRIGANNVSNANRQTITIGNLTVGAGASAADGERAIAGMQAAIGGASASVGNAYLTDLRRGTLPTL